MLDPVVAGDLANWTLPAAGGNPTVAFEEIVSPYDSSIALRTTATGTTLADCTIKYTPRDFQLPGSVSSAAYALQLYLALDSDMTTYNWPGLQVDLLSGSAVVADIQYYRAAATGTFITQRTANWHAIASNGFQTLPLSPLLDGSGAVIPTPITFDKIRITMVNYACVGTNSVIIDALSLVPTDPNAAGGRRDGGTGATVLDGGPDGAGTPSTAQDGAGPEPSNPVLTPLVSQPVTAAGGAQSVAYKDQVRITLPGGAVHVDGTLVISSVSGVPDPSPFRHLQGAYAITLGDQHTFDQDLSIELSYDPKILDSKKPATAQLMAVYWDQDAAAWLPVDYSVDEARHVVRITSDHLSIYGYLSWIAGYSVAPSEHFSLVYDDKAIRGGPGGSYVAVMPARTGEPPFISDSIQFLETAYKAYQAGGYTLPSGVINAEVYDFQDSELGTLSGIVRLSTISWQAYQNQDTLKHDAGHELFHAVQRASLGIKNYLLRKWWMEATADYASDMVAWNGTIHEMGLDIRPKYLEQSITYTKDFHDYSTSYFIDYLVKHQDVYEFSDLWFQTAGAGNDVLATLSKKIQNPLTLSMQYQDFATYFVFDPASPVKYSNAAKKIEISIPNDIAAVTSPWGPGDKELQQSFDIPYFAAKVWAVKNQVDRQVLIERKDQSTSSLRYAVLAGETRSSAVKTPPTELETGKSATVAVKAGEILYLLASNTISASAQTAVVHLSEGTAASGLFTLQVTYDTGCDAAYSWDYNEFSRVKLGPVRIDGKNVTIDYDRSGVGHLVAQGSGKIDDKGVMTAQAIITYTRSYSCDGTPCTGTETAQVSFSTSLDMWGIWQGTASGSVTVDFPNTMGKSGDDSRKCTAAPTSVSIFQGFKDIDDLS